VEANAKRGEDSYSKGMDKRAAAVPQAIHLFEYFEYLGYFGNYGGESF